MMDATAEFVALSLVTGVGSRTAARLIDRFGSPAGVFRAGASALSEFGLKPELIDRLKDPSPRRAAEEELRRLESFGGRALTLADPRFPQLLKETYDPPIVLYATGRLEVLERPCLAIVGTRQPSSYGQNAALSLSRDLATRGVTIVSGFARGIDGAAHRGALQAGGGTIAVLGTGLDVPYPKEHRKLREEIRAQGLVLTEFVLGVAPTPQNFPYRNRVISGLSLGTMVVEAAEHSGSLITARLAMEQNREVFAVPGNISSSKSFGPNYLIKSGAKLVQLWRDVVEEFPPEWRRRILSDELSRGSAAVEQAIMVLDERERKVLRVLSGDAPRHVDELTGTTGLPPSELMGVLLALEMKEQIRQLPGKTFIKKL
ncbi:MAG: DNA-protecting protein DprA [Acidobacteria bacterium]|nr:DNA-protecting protein DprA [Acidobacteriota bacterium]